MCKFTLENTGMCKFTLEYTGMCKLTLEYTGMCKHRKNNISGSSFSLTQC